MKTIPKILLFLMLLFLGTSGIYAQIAVTGTVVDNANQPLPGTNILVKGTQTGAMADANGKFTISVPSTSSILVFTFIGYDQQEIVVGNQTVVSVTLLATSLKLEEVVVTGYATQKKESVTASISSVKATELKQSPATNISNALAGRLTGLTTVQSTGQPGSDESTLYVRGIGTYTGNTSPLIMVDGVARDNYNNIDPNDIESISILKDASATAVFGVRGANGVVLITTKRGKTGAPNASFSAEVAVTTFINTPKMMDGYDYALGTNWQLKDSYWGNHAKDADINSWDKFLAKRDANWIFDGAAMYWTPDQLRYLQNANTPKLADGTRNPWYDPILYPDQDWQKLLFKKYALKTNYNLSLNGGTDLVKYFVSVGYLNQGGQVKTDFMAMPDESQFGYKRYNLRANFDFDISKAFKISVDVANIVEQQSGINQDIFDFWSRNVWWQMPNGYRGNYWDGKIIQPYFSRGPMSVAYWDMENQGFLLTKKNTLNSNIKIRYDLGAIVKGLSINARVAYDSYFQSSSSGGIGTPIYYKVYPNPNGDISNPLFKPATNPDQMPHRSADSYNGKWRKIYGEASLNYNRNFGNHEVSGLVLANAEKRYDPNYAFQLPHSVLGFVGRATYSYGNKYLAEFDMGYNGSENFPVGQRYGFFPSYSLGWVVTNESFFPKNNVLTFLKLRGSRGKVGNDNVGSSRFLYMPGTWNYDGKTAYFGTPTSPNYITGAQQGALENTNVTWETATKTDGGFEARLFGDKLTIAYAHFYEDRVNILSFRNTIPDMVQATLPPYNLGKMTNWGDELEVGWRSKIGNVTFWIKGNISTAYNKVIFRDEAIIPGLEYQAETGHSLGTPLQQLTNGIYTSWSQLYAIDANGNPILSQPVLALNKAGEPYNNAAGKPVYQKDLGNSGYPLQPGSTRIIDYNEDGVIDAKDNVRIGKPSVPPITYGIPFGIEWKGFDFSVLFQGATGNERYFGVFNNYLSQRAVQSYAANMFTIQRYNDGAKMEYPLKSGNYLIDGSYIRFKNFQIGYTFTPSFLRKVGIKTARLYANANNIYTWTYLRNGDPEQSNSFDETYPLVGTYNLGLNITF